jgi:hypothetical protein
VPISSAPCATPSAVVFSISPVSSSITFLKELKGTRRGAYAAIWIFESREAWERLWGSPEAPRPATDYPDKWKVWENVILAPFLTQDPDKIGFTSYLEV